MLLEEAFGEQAKVYMGESVFLVHLRLRCPLSSDALCQALAKRGLLVFPIHKSSAVNDGTAHIALSCCEVSAERFADAVTLLKETASHI